MRSILAILFASGLLAAATKEVPEWVREAARQPSKSDYPAKVTAVVLLNEEHLSVEPDGKWVMTTRGAVKVLRSGPPALEAAQAYNTKTGRIRDFRGWLLYPSGKEIEFPKNRILDIAFNDDKTPYDETRIKVLECEPDAPAGSVFAYEVIEEEGTIFTTYPYHFQGHSPVLISRFVLSLPAGWETRATAFNHSEIQPHVDGNSYTWELRDLPWIEDEEYRPGYASLSPRLGVTYFPSTAANPVLRPLKDWPTVSAWLANFVDPPAIPTSAVRSKSNELTSTSKSALDKIRAIAAFTQQTNYVSVDMNVTHGGGYTPHSADQVLSKNYGDCKDKAALMRALLKAAGIDSYAVVIYSGDRQFVRPEWPSPNQFNHAIVAVKVSADTSLPTVTDHARLGRLLIFDPTDPSTPVGGLPNDEQGSYALVIAGPEGDLVKMPLLPPDSNRVERTVEAQMDADGRLKAHMLTQYFGQPGSAMRYSARHGGVDEMKRGLERSFSRRLGGVTLEKVSPTDHGQDGQLELAVDFSVNQFGQLMQSRMLVLNPGALVPAPDYIFANKERKLPIKLSARSRKDAVTIKLPAGFNVDEMPDPIEIQSPYGTYRATWKSGNDAVTFEQSVEIKDALAAVPEYARIKDFFDKLAAGQSAAVVLLKAR